MKNFANSRVWTAMLFILILLVAPLGVPANLQAADLTNGLPASLPVGNEDVVRTALYQAITGPVKLVFRSTDSTVREFFYPPWDGSFTYSPEMGRLEDVIVSKAQEGGHFLVDSGKYTGQKFSIGVEGKHGNWDLFNHYHEFNVPSSFDQIDEEVKNFPIDIFMYYIPVYAPAVKYVEMIWAPETQIVAENSTNGAPSYCSLSTLAGDGWIYLYAHKIADFAGEIKLYTDDAHTQFVSYKYPYVGPHLTIRHGRNSGEVNIDLLQTTALGGVLEVSTDNSNWTPLKTFFAEPRPIHISDPMGVIQKFYRLRITW